MDERTRAAVDNYEVKLRLGARIWQTEDQIQRQVEHYETAYALLKQKVDEGREVLRMAGVSPIWFPYYHSFTRELYKLTRRELSERALVAAYAQIAEKWRMRGLNLTVLKQIGVDVYNLPWPATADNTQA
jgi:hypothetical protein